MSVGPKSAEEAAIAARPGPTTWTVAVVATLGMSVSYVDRQTLAAIAPDVTKALAIDNSRYGLLVSAFSMAYLIGSPLAGVVVDRFGARRCFAGALVVWSVIAALHSLVASFAVLFALRILLGLAESPSFPSAAQAIRRALPGTRRPLAFGLLFTGSSLGAIVAGKLAVRLAAAYGFRAAFIGTALIGAAWLPFWLLATRRAGLGPPVKTEDASSTSTSAPSARGEWFAVATSAPVLRTLVACGGAAPLLMFVLNWTSKYLVEGWKLAPSDVGNLLIWPPLVFDVGAIGFGALANLLQDRDGTSPRGLIVFAMLLAASLVLAPFAPSPSTAIAVFAVAAAGGGGIYVLATNDMLARVPVERTSAAGGLAAASQSLAHIIAGPFVGWTIDRTQSHSVALFMLGGIVIPTSLAFVFWPGLCRRPQ